MLTIGPPGFLAFVAYLVIFGLIWRSIASHISAKNPDNALARAMHFIY